MKVRHRRTRGKGVSPAVRLARFYVRRSGMGDTVTRKDVGMIKKIIAAAGSERDAERVLLHHLSDSWRWQNQKPLEHILVHLDKYRGFLGLLPAEGVIVIPRPRMWEATRAATIS